jgi:hypothetical protein
MCLKGCRGADDVGSPRLLLMERRRQPAVVVTEWKMSHAERTYQNGRKSMKKAKRKKSRSSSKKTRRSAKKGLIRRAGAKLKRVANKTARATGLA